MKKFFNDNITWIVIIALALGGYAAYYVWKSKKDGDSALSEPALTPGE